MDLLQKVVVQPYSVLRTKFSTKMDGTAQVCQKNGLNEDVQVPLNQIDMVEEFV